MTTASESSEKTSQLSLFGETCERSTVGLLPTPRSSPNENRTTKPTPAQMKGTHGKYLAVVALTSSPQGIPASHSHSPGSDWARRMTAIYGRKLSAFWLSCDPPDSWVRTLLDTSIWGSMTCWLTWKKSVTPHGRLLFRLQVSTPRTAGIGSGLWPTPVAQEGGEGVNPSDRGRKLHREVLWGTPTSRDHKDVGDMTNVPENGLLGRQVLNDARMWPTPRVEGFAAGKHRGKADSLYSAVNLWPTPHSNASTGAGTQGREGGENLQTAVQMYGTPRAIYGEHAGMSDPSHLTGQAGATGNLKLNSAWVSRMMGYPDGYLILDGEATP